MKIAGYTRKEMEKLAEEFASNRATAQRNRVTSADEVREYMQDQIDFILDEVYAEPEAKPADPEGPTLTQKDYRNLKSRLTRVINKGDPDKIIAEVDHAIDIFTDKGYPDAWHRWPAAKRDAEVKKRSVGC